VDTQTNIGLPRSSQAIEVPFSQLRTTSQSYKLNHSWHFAFYTTAISDRYLFSSGASPPIFFILVQYLNCIFRINIACTAPYCCYSHQVSKLTLSAAQNYHRPRKTYCIAVIAELTSTLTKGDAVVAPIKANCNAVLYLLMVVGRTSAEGREKSQYRKNVLGGGSEIQR
jgi:hypothetical protein